MADGLIITMVGGADAAAAVAGIIGRVQAVTPAVVADLARQAVVNVRSHMNGRPGPNRISGTLQESLTVQRVSVTGYAVYPSAPYSRRIELGFVGSDSLGRVYNQPPYPYFWPGIADTVAAGNASLVASWSEALTI